MVFFVLSYLLINALAIYLYNNGINQEFIKEKYFFISLIYCWLIFDVLYKHFRKLSTIIIWGIIGVVQLYFYLEWKELEELKAVNGSYIDSMKMLPLTLSIIVLSNFINKKIYGDFFIPTTFIFDMKEIKDGRELRTADYIISMLGFLIIITSLVW